MVKWGNGARGRDDRETGKLQSAAKEEKGKGVGFFFFFWFRSGRGCGPGRALLRGALPLCGRASCASCAPSCPCGGGAGNGGLVGLAEQTQREERYSQMKERAGGLLNKVSQRWTTMKGGSGNSCQREMNH